MDKIKLTNQFLRSALIGLGIIAAAPAWSATPVDLSRQNISILSSIQDVREVKRTVGVNGTVHIRVQQYYKQYPVFAADAVVHFPNADKKSLQLATAIKTSKGFMNGTLYQGISQDLAGTPAMALTTARANQAIPTAVDLYQQQKDAAWSISKQKSEVIVFVDEKAKAHFAYRVSFFAEAPAKNQTPAMPVYILDAKTLAVLKTWDDVHAGNAPTPALSTVNGGGFGGNKKIGQVSYDGLPGQLGIIAMSRDDAAGICYLKNARESITLSNHGPLVSFACPSADPQHNNVYWNGELMAVGGAYSPVNDAMYNSETARHMFENWYHVEPVTVNGQAVPLAMFYGYTMGNAIYSNGVLSMGNGGFWYFYPWTTRDVVSHEISHGFTEQYSKLLYTGQAGGLNESFGDITAKAVELYATGSNTWVFGADVVTVANEAVRYFVQPSLDCQSKVKPDQCSIDNMSEYNANLLPHPLAGIFNRAFYLWATSPGWTTKKAYDVMVAANMHYWTSNTTFQQAACGVIKAATDFSYPTTAITSAFQTVGLDTSSC